MNTQRVEGHTPLPWSATENGLIHGGQYNTPIAHIGSSSLMVGSVMERNANIAFIVHACNNIERLEKVNEALVGALEEVSQVLTVEEHQNPGKGWGDFLEKDVLPALSLAKEPA